jgi:hypothetical protein
MWTLLLIALILAMLFVVLGTSVALQPWLGLLPERRRGIGAGGSAALYVLAARLTAARDEPKSRVDLEVTRLRGVTPSS